MTQNDHDPSLDDLVRAASQRDADEGAIYHSVIRKLDEPRQPWLSLPSLGPSTAIAGFAAMMFVAGLVGYALPDLAAADSEESILSLAVGEPTLVNGSLASLVIGSDQ